ncbi:unnamed protein product [Mycena citricolor]|uniref:Uncharacterized protein n=1 Tax=Mycena citricolor TaxID=2018698 RepID=A0AAD2HVP3_9AGAR|nr:unnamed protein product [Mycena citricolor]
MPAASSLSATAVSSSASATATLPAGCSLSSFNGGVTLSSDFEGCTTSTLFGLDSCCAAAGSIPAFVNNTCGCPLDKVASAKDARDAFTSCTAKLNLTSGCGGYPLPSATPKGGAVGREAGVRFAWVWVVLLSALIGGAYVV